MEAVGGKGCGDSKYGESIVLIVINKIIEIDY